MSVADIMDMTSSYRLHDLLLAEHGGDGFEEHSECYACRQCHGWFLLLLEAINQERRRRNSTAPVVNDSIRMCGSKFVYWSRRPHVP